MNSYPAYSFIHRAASSQRHHGRAGAAAPEPSLKLWATALLATLLPLVSSAASASLDWHKVAGGGGYSQAGNVSLVGTIGQADAGTVQGGNVTIHGGFLAFDSIASPPPEVITWTNLAGGNWTTPANWSPNKVPGPAHVAVINLPGTYTVRFDYNAQCATLLLGGAAGIQSVDWAYGSFTGTMIVETNAVVNLVGGSISLNGTVRNRGRIEWPANKAVTWRLNAGSRIVNEISGLMDLRGNGWFSGYAPSSIHNLGAIRKSADAGNIQATAGLDFFNGGLIDIQNGTLSLNGLDSSNAVKVASGAVLKLAGGSVNFYPGHAFAGSGTCWLGGFAAIKGPLAGPVTFTVSEAGPFNAELRGNMWWTNGDLKGNLTIAKDAAFNLLNWGGGHLSLYGTITNEGYLKWTGASSLVTCYETARIENKPGSVFDIAFDASLYLPLGASFNNQGTILKSAGTNAALLRGDFAFTNSGLIDLRSGNLELTDGLTSSGTINVAQGSDLRFRGGVFNFGPDHVFTGLGTCTFGASSLRLNGLLSGTVVFQMDYGAVFDCTLKAPMSWLYGNPSGALTVDAGGILTMVSPGSLGGTITNFGVVNWASNGSWRWDEGTWFENKAGALFNIKGNPRIYGTTVGRVFHNLGTIRKSEGTGIAVYDVPLINSGVLDVQSGGLRLVGGYQDGPASTLSVFLGETTQGLQMGQVEFVLPATFGGRFALATSAGFAPLPGASFTLLKYPSATGVFSAYDGLVLSGGIKLVPQFGPTAFTLTAALAQSPPLAATITPGKLKISWPPEYANWRLYSATNLLNPVWQVVPVQSGTTIEIPPAKPHELFRLGSP